MELITGATGFIGRYLALRLIAENKPVRVLCRPESRGKLDPKIVAQAEVALGDLRDAESLDRATEGTSRIFHCAGHVSDWGSELDYGLTNVRGTEFLLKSAARRKIQRFVHLSSIAVFGVPAPSYFDDQTPYGSGADLYSRTKIEGEKLALRYHREEALPVTVLRPPVVYGRHGTWLEEPLKMIRENKMFLLGGGRGTCHPCYIENLIDAMILVSERTEAIGQAYIVGDDEPISFRDYFHYLARLAGQGPVRRSIPLWAARAMATTLETATRLGESLGHPSGRPLLTHTAIDMVCTPSQMSMRKIRDQLQYRPRYSVSTAMQDIQARLR